MGAGRILGVALLFGCQGPAPTPGGAPGGSAASAPTPAPPVEGDPAALFDDAVRAELDGDAFEARDQWIRLAARYPDTPYGRQATARIGGGETPMVAVAIIGIISAVAIPSFIGYQNKASASEATLNLRFMVDGAMRFYDEPEVNADGEIQPKRFPPSTTLTAADCGGSVPDPATWEAPGWQGLGFAPSDSLRFRYVFLSEGEGLSARFTARAIGDLDCDGVFSTYERVGAVAPDGLVILEALRVENEGE
ncbi:MAG: hypothetical protein KC549_15910 [Myxococcales bacterium]|nr:hypothetical protein [Myxococcales bacterium]MCB9549653.1 hypothetical protein [Myxococcales bacterium]